jgi:DNA polymerase I-like protein with 3'-5' exonuclease and polymerase domains
MKMETTLDVETTTFSKGNPFSRRNRLCTVGLLRDGDYSDYDIEYSDSPYGSHLQRIKEIVEESDLLIGFNIKFDLHWLRRYCGPVSFRRVWDCQLAEFYLSGQKLFLDENSLGGALVRYNLPPKLDVVRLEYWERGFDTPDVPYDLLTEYQKVDILGTKAVKDIQYERFKKEGKNLYRSFKLACEDLLVLQEAEFAGMYFNASEARLKAEQAEKDLDAIEQRLSKLVGDSRINWGSSDHVSAVLYGGTISFKVRERTERVLKDGSVKIGERWGIDPVEFPRLVKPVDRSETKDTAGMSEDDLARRNREAMEAGRRIVQRTYSVDEPTLRSLKGSKRVKSIIEALLSYSEIKKLLSVYYRGLPEKIDEMDWEPGTLHGNFNQSIAATSRLTSSNPNLQNLAAVTKPLFVSRYAGDRRL